jgi:hydroxyacylglutathione hydrolase
MCTREVDDAANLVFSSGVRIKPIHTPCHTLNHMMYEMIYLGQSAVFTGDCIFLGGAGKFFEGAAGAMTHILRRCIKEIPP